MKKEEFLRLLESKLQGLPRKDIDDRLNFFSEIIDDKMEEGKSEEEAVAEVGSVDDIVLDIAKETPLTKLVREKIKPKREIRAWEIVFLILGFPLWFPLVLTFLILALVFYLLIWVLVLVAYTVEISFIASFFAGMFSFFTYIGSGTFHPLSLGCAIMGLGGALLMLFVCKIATIATLKLSNKILMRIKAAFIRKGE